MPGSRLRELNGFELDRTVEDAVDQTLKVASGEIDEESMASWLRSRVRPALTD
jgi:prophage maintenance system killer protein